MRVSVNCGFRIADWMAHRGLRIVLEQIHQWHHWAIATRPG
jgi:hypothetical protein